MKKIITADTVRALIRRGDNILLYNAMQDLITPQAYDLLREYNITLQNNGAQSSKRIESHHEISPQFCGIRPNFTISDRELIYFRIIERLRQQYPNHQTDETTLRTLIEPILNRYLPQ